MGAAPGIAGSTVPEEDGVFLCPDEFTAGFFIRMNNSGGPVDLWAVSGIDEEPMLDNGSGFFVLPWSDLGRAARPGRSAGATLGATRMNGYLILRTTTNIGAGCGRGRGLV